MQTSKAIYLLKKLEKTYKEAEEQDFVKAIRLASVALDEKHKSEIESQSCKLKHLYVKQRGGDQMVGVSSIFKRV